MGDFNMIPVPNEGESLVSKFEQRLSVSKFEAVLRVIGFLFLSFLLTLISVCVFFVVIKCHELLVFQHYVVFTAVILLFCLFIYKIQKNKTKVVWWRIKFPWCN
jgi:uncharacterized membrane protein